MNSIILVNELTKKGGNTLLIKKKVLFFAHEYCIQCALCGKFLFYKPVEPLDSLLTLLVNKGKMFYYKYDKFEKN